MTNQPFVVTELGCSYRELFWLIEQLPMCRGDDQSLPSEIIHKITNFFTVEPVVSSEVVAARATSTDGRHDLQACLDTSQSSWWLSSFGSMPKGRGEQYVEFQLSSKPRRLCSVSVEIPPLPLGPLSARTMRLDSKFGDTWRQVSPVWTVENKTGWQQYELHPPVDAQFVRVVCLTNQMAQFLRGGGDDQIPEPEVIPQFASVGYYCVKFE
jgi:hypothetical protein